MTEQEKVIWKVEILKHSEDMDDLIDQKIREIQDERDKINECVKDSKQMINSYETAVDRIAAKSKRPNMIDPSFYERLINQ